MKKIRLGTFETNSSSTHSLTIKPKDVFEKFEKGEIHWNVNANAGHELDPVDWDAEWEENKEWYDTKEEFLKENCLLDFNAFMEHYDEDFDTFEEGYTTPSGDEIVVFGYYGHD